MLLHDMFETLSGRRQARRSAPCEHLRELMRRLDERRRKLERALTRADRPAKRRRLRHSLDVVRLQMKKGATLKSRIEEDC